ncbi:MAG TPA: multidrug ABC transporter permease, partial [Stellaceae bacterium]|nr:multidrug ABC transporter permease [Stellaceae bacterium]
YYICLANPFTHAVELVRFALYGKLEPVSAAVVLGTLLLFMLAAIYGYDPSRGLIARRVAAE